MKKLIIGLLAVGVIAGLYFFFFKNPKSEVVENYRGVTFLVSGEPQKLGADYEYFGNEVRKDLDGDGSTDIAFLVSNNDRFFLVASLKRDGGYIGSQAVMIGDDIRPQTTESGEGRDVIVNYATGQNPSLGHSLYLRLNPQTLEFGEVVQNFEGESR